MFYTLQPHIISEVPNNESEEPSDIVSEVPNNESEEPLRRSQRVRKSAISGDYVTYNTEFLYNVEGLDDIMWESDPTSFKEAIKSKYSSEWFNAMNDEIKSMSTNKV